MNVDLKGKLAVVTGAGRGLGQQVARQLAAHGAAVAVVARHPDQLHQPEQAIKKTGSVAWSIPADVGQPEAVDTLKKEVEARCGSVSILVNSAGIFGPIQLIKDSDPTRWIETLAVNLFGPYLTCRAFVGG